MFLELFLPPPTHAELGFTWGKRRFERMRAFGVQWSFLLPKSPQTNDFGVSCLELLGSFLKVLSCVFFDLFLVSGFLCFFEILGSLLGPSWGTLGGKSDHFGTLFWRFPVRMPVWCDFGPSGEDFGRHWGGFWCILAGFGDHFGRLFGVVAGSWQTPWPTPWPANLHQKTFAAPHQLGTGRNVAAAT